MSRLDNQLSNKTPRECLINAFKYVAAGRQTRALQLKMGAKNQPPSTVTTTVNDLLAEFVAFLSDETNDFSLDTLQAFANHIINELKIHQRELNEDEQFSVRLLEEIMSRSPA